MFLSLEATAGDDVPDLCQAVISVANTLRITVVCEVNGLHLMGCPGDDSDLLYSAYRTAIQSRPYPNLPDSLPRYVRGIRT